MEGLREKYCAVGSELRYRKAHLIEVGGGRVRRVLLDVSVRELRTPGGSRSRAVAFSQRFADNGTTDHSENS